PTLELATPDIGEASLLGEMNYLCGERERETYKAFFVTLREGAKRCSSSFGGYSLLMWTAHN
ncbi:unnamed protein product, partial [Brassica rapa subsp. narinosa]